MSGVKSPGLLPPGWSVESKARKNGKIDKIVVEKAVAEELPRGWIKELKITKKGSKIRKDPYYIDPVTGYIFRSLKDVHRYLKTGDIGRLASKPKDSSRTDIELEDDKLPAPEAERHKLADDGANGQIAGNQASKLVEIVNDARIVESMCTADRLFASESASEPSAGKESAAISDVNLPKANKSEGREEKSEPTKHIVSAPLAGTSPEKKSEERDEKSELTEHIVSASLAGTSPEKESEEKSESTGDIVSAPLIGTSAEKRPLENGLEVHENNEPERKKSRKNSKLSLPRRTSKRLAGIEIDLPPEPKSRRQASTRRFVEAETSNAGLAIPEDHDRNARIDNGHNGRSEKQVVDPVILPQANLSTPKEHSGGGETNLSIPEEHDVHTKMDSKPREIQELPVVLHPASICTPEEPSGKVEKDNKVSEKQELPTVLPLVPLSTPKEHTGEVETKTMPKEKQEERDVKAEMDINPSVKQVQPILSILPSLATSGKIETDNKPLEKQPVVTPPVSLLIPEEHAGEVKTDNKADVKPESPMNLCLMDLWTDPCIEFAVKTLTGAIPVGDENKTKEYPGSPLHMPLGELWTDPCIEFAVKTLTGAIPVGEDLCIQDYLQQQHSSSSETQGENGFSLPHIGLNHFCQTDVLSQHFDNAENSLCTQPDLVVPVLPNQRNVSLQNSSKGRSGECSRPTLF